MKQLLAMLLVIGCVSCYDVNREYYEVPIPEQKQDDEKVVDEEPVDQEPVKDVADQPKKEPPVIEPPSVEPPKPCEAGQAVSWLRDLKPLMQNKCGACHAVYLDYDKVVDNYDEIMDRINLPFNDPKRMPLRPKPELAPNEKKLYEDFQDDDFQEQPVCRDDLASASVFKSKTLKNIEIEILNDLNRLNSVQQKQARYLILTNNYNQKKDIIDMAYYEAALNKSLNSLSFIDFMVPASPIDKDSTIYRFFLQDYGLDQKAWDLVLTKDKFKFISKTNLGKQVTAITGSKQPWLHGDNFILIAFGDPEIYNHLMKVPKAEAELFRKLGVNIQTEIDNFRLRAIGFNGSPISLNKNRMLTRVENVQEDRYIWKTYDPNGNFLVNKNLFQFPLLKQFGGKANFDFDASEIIFQLPNGLQGYALYTDLGHRVTEAPISVVQNIESPFSPIIKNGLDCFRCHNQGLINIDDQIRDHVAANASQFDRNDVELVDAFYKSNTVNRALFNTDKTSFARAARKIGDNLLKDPMNGLVDQMRFDQNLEQVAARVFLDPSTFRKELSKSSILKPQLGQLLTGGQITLTQLQQSFADILKELRVNEDGIDD